MQFNHSYFNSSTIRNEANQTAMSFSPDVTRDPTYFSGELHSKIPFREAISALNNVVVSNLTLQTKEREEYKAWLENQELIDFEAVARENESLAKTIEEKRLELESLQSQHYKRMKPFYAAQSKYFKYLLKRDYAAWYVLDPVITVHPDKLFFECFSQDESSYGCLSANYNVFNNIGDFECGTTNIDYSEALYNEFQKVRNYRATTFAVEASGFSVKTEGEAAFKEVKIDLPDSWVRGFLQVNSAMTLPAVTFDLHPMDIHNICFILRRNKELVGPRSMRYILTPGKPVRIVFDPWDKEIVCSRSIFTGDSEHNIRVWGRRRLHILERLVPIAKRFTVRLLGYGMPSFYTADLGDMNFTLGLSGWTANDWSRSGNFDLMAPRLDVDDMTKQKVYAALKKDWYATPDALSKQLNLDRSIVLSSLSAYTQAGRAIYDLGNQVYRARELTKDPLPMDKLRFSNPKEEQAALLVVHKKVKIKDLRYDSHTNESFIRGHIKDNKKKFELELHIDKDDVLVSATCSCNFFQQNKLFKGPCEHILALRSAARKKLDRR